MADINASIPLQVQQPDFSNLNDPTKMMQLGQQMQKMQAMKREQQTQMTLQQLYSDQKNFDSTGNLTEDAIKQVGTVDPGAAMQLKKVGLANQEVQARMQGQKADLTKKKLELQHEGTSAALITYEDSLKKGVSDMQAREMAQKTYDQGFDSVKKSGLFSDEELQRAPKQFDPQMARSFAINYDKYQTLQGQEATRKEHERHDLVEEHGQAETRAETRKRDAQSARNEDLTRAQSGERLKMERERLNSDKFTDNKEVQVRDENGDVKTVLAQQNKKTHDWIDSKGQSIKGEVIGTAKEGRDETKAAQNAAKISAGILSDDALAMKTDQYLSGDKSVFTGLGRGAQGAENIAALNNSIAKIAKDRGVSGKDLVQLQANLKADTSSQVQLTKMSDAAISFEETAMKNMTVAEDLMSKGVGPTGLPIVDKWVQAGRKATGSPDVVAFDTALTTLSNEYAKIMSGATGSQGATVDARREAREMLDKAMNEDQLRAVFDVMKRDMNNRKSSLLESRKNIQDRTGESKSESKMETKPGSITAEDLAKKSDADILKGLGITQ